MHFINHKFFITLVAGGTLAFMTSCSKEEDPFADAAQGGGKEIINLKTDSSDTGHYTLFSFKTGQTVPNSDSATDKWDIGFLATTIIVNSGNSGPSVVQAQTFKGIYAEQKSAPLEGYLSDTPQRKAIMTGSGNGWYNYNEDKHVITAIPGRTLFFRTTEGKFVKMEIYSYYKDKPADKDLDYMSSIPRYYSFRYELQTNGSNQFQ